MGRNTENDKLVISKTEAATLIKTTPKEGEIVTGFNLQGGRDCMRDAVRYSIEKELRPRAAQIERERKAAQKRVDAAQKAVNALKLTDRDAFPITVAFKNDCAAVLAALSPFAANWTAVKAVYSVDSYDADEGTYRMCAEIQGMDDDATTEPELRRDHKLTDKVRRLLEERAAAYAEIAVLAEQARAVRDEMESVEATANAVLTEVELQQMELTPTGKKFAALCRKFGDEAAGELDKHLAQIRSDAAKALPSA